VPRLRAAGPNEVWNWDITYLPTTVRGVWLYLYLVLDLWSRKVVAWDVAEREHRSGSGESGLPTRADQQRSPAAVDPACR